MNIDAGSTLLHDFKARWDIKSPRVVRAIHPFLIGSVKKLAG